MKNNNCIKNWIGTNFFSFRHLFAFVNSESLNRDALYNLLLLWVEARPKITLDVIKE